MNVFALIAARFVVVAGLAGLSFVALHKPDVYRPELVEDYVVEEDFEESFDIEVDYDGDLVLVGWTAYGYSVLFDDGVRLFERAYIPDGEQRHFNYYSITKPSNEAGRLWSGSSSWLWRGSGWARVYQ